MSPQFHITVDWEESWCRMTQKIIYAAVFVQGQGDHAHTNITRNGTYFRLFRKVQRTEEEECLSTATQTGNEDHHNEADPGDILYPPKEEWHMVQYILKYKKLPDVLPEQSSLHIRPKSSQTHVLFKVGQ